MLEGMGQEVTVLRPMALDDFGRGKRDFDESHKLYDVLVDITDTSSNDNKQSIDRISGTMWMQFGSDIKAGDRVEFFDSASGKDRIVHVEGRPFEVHFGGFDPGIRVRFKEVGGDA